MIHQVFKTVRKLVPRISDTELIALKSGTTSLDRTILLGQNKLIKKINKDFDLQNIALDDNTSCTFTYAEAADATTPPVIGAASC